MSLSSLVDSKFYRQLMEEDGGNVKELLDAEEYLVPQPGFFENQANGLSRHHSHRVRCVPLSSSPLETCAGSTWVLFTKLSRGPVFIMFLTSLMHCLHLTAFCDLNQPEHRPGTGGGRRAEWAEHALISQHAGAQSIPNTSCRSHGQWKLGRLSVPLAGPKPVPLLGRWSVRLRISGWGQGRASL